MHTHTFLIEEKVFKVRHVNPALASLYGGSLEITLTVPLIKHQAVQVPECCYALVELMQILYSSQHALLE